MKTILFFITFLLILLNLNAQPSPEGCYESNNCTNFSPCLLNGACSGHFVGNPYFGTCAAALDNVDKFLKRSMQVKNLVWLNIDQGSNNPKFNTTLYCSTINMLADNNIQYIMRPADHWGTQGGDWWGALKQMICDIDYAYDCRSQRRPLIDFNLFEHVDESVHYYHICQEIIDLFKNEIIASGQWPFTFTDFDLNSIYYLDSSKNAMNGGCTASICGVPDISRVMARMYLFYLAKRAIDLGITIIGFGDTNAMVLNDQLPGHENENLYNLIQKIRTYAKSKNIQSLLIYGGPNIRKLGGTNQLIFDFVLTPQWPAESSNFFPSNSPCGIDPLQAKLGDDPNVSGLPWGDDGSGIAPDGCQVDCTPILVDFDHFGNCGGTLGVYNTDVSCCYGYDESSWFDKLSDGCKKQYLEYYLCNINENHCRTAMILPGLLSVTDQTTLQSSVIWNIKDHPKIDSLIQEYLEVKEPSIHMEEVCDAIIQPNCDEHFLYSDQNYDYYSVNHKLNKFYTFEVENSDCSSEYTWHIFKLPNGPWLDYTRGKKRVVSVTEPGTYEVRLRRDNASSNPYEYQIMGTYYLEPYCCADTWTIEHRVHHGHGIDGRSGPTITESYFNIYPNPSNEEITIDIPILNKEDTEIIIFNSIGDKVDRFILPYNTTSIQRNIKNLASGNYNILISGSGLSKSFVKY